jgi:signal transduction histidine kinase/CheY-like chemotaxis protein/HPt (histidine-containing phosphotransfer) domain-containing protein/streptogramin lyase
MTATRVFQKRSKRIIFLILFVLSSFGCPVFGVPASSLEQMSAETFSAKEGLPFRTVRDIFQDRLNRLWIAANEGVALYDGQSFQIFPSSESGLQGEFFFATSILQGYDGKIWISNDTSASALYWISEDLSEEGVFKNLPRYISSIAPGRGQRLFINARKHLDSFVAGKTEMITDFDRGSLGRVLYPLESGGFIVGQGNRGVKWANDQAETLFTLPDEDFQIMSAIPAQAGGFWVASNGRGLYRVYADGRTKYYSEATGLPVSKIRCMIEDSLGNLWIGGYGGIVRFDGEQFEQRSFTQTPEVEIVFSIVEDVENNIWLGTTEGLRKLSPKNLHNFGPQQGISSFLHHSLIISPSGKLLIGGEGTSLYQIDPLTNKASQLLEFDRHYDFPLVFSPDGDVSILAEKALIKIDETTAPASLGADILIPDLKDRSSVRLTKDPTGQTWLYIAAKIYLWRDRAWQLIADVSDSSKRSKDPYFFMIDSKQRAWIGTGRKLRILDLNQNPPTEETHSMAATCIVEVDDSFWVGNANGNIHRIKSNQLAKLQTHPKIAAVRGHVFGMIADGRGNLWVMTQGGIIRLPIEQLSRNIDEGTNLIHARAFGSSFGISDYSWSLKYFKNTAMSPDGRLWFAHQTGVVVIDPEQVRTNEIPPTIQLNQFRVDGIELARDRWDEEIELAAGTASIEFDIFVISLSHPRKVQAEYRIVGMHQDWLPFQGNIRLGQLPPGEHALEVRAFNEDGIGGSPVQIASLRQLPYFYQSAWFYILLICSSGLSVFIIFLRREKKANEQKATLQHLVEQRSAELKLSEQKALRLAQKAEAGNQAKGEFLANMSHEIRTPLNGILGMGELLENTPMNSEQSFYLKNLRSSGEALLSIISDILDFSKIEAGRMEIENKPFDFQKLVHHVGQLLVPACEPKGVELLIRFDPQAPSWVSGDAGRIRQVLLNLVGNAAKFTERGYVLVNISAIEMEETSVRIKVEVEDTGVGISEEFQKQIFDKFTQEGAASDRAKGTGLGMAISFRLVEMMQGRLELDSQLGKGSKFSFEIPLEVVEQQLSESGEDPVKAGRVILAGENVLNRNIIKELLVGWKVPFYEISSGAECLSLLSDRDNSSGKINTVLVDKSLEDMSGLDLVKKLKELCGSELSVILLVESGKQDAFTFTQQYPNVWILPRPATPSMILRALQQATDEKEPDSQFVQEKTHPQKTSAKDWNLKVLLAEDNIPSRMVAATLLRKMGCTVDTVKNGREAVEFLSRDAYDLVLMDNQMPGMDGFDATRQWRKLEAQQADQTRTIIVALTANALKGDRQKCLDAGMDDYLAKPVSKDALTAMLAHFFQKNREHSLDNPEKSKEAHSLGKPVSREFNLSSFEGIISDDEDFGRTLIEHFLNEIDQDCELLKNARFDDNPKDVALAAHRIAGSVLTVGGENVARLARRIESRADHETGQSIDPEWYNELDQSVQSLKAELQAHIRSYES